MQEMKEPGKRSLKGRIKNALKTATNGELSEGVSNNLNFETLEEGLKQAIQDRRDICVNCPYSSDNAKKDGWYSSIRPDNHCVLCDCNIDWKTASPDSECGAAIYNAEKNENLEVKWTKIEK